MVKKDQNFKIKTEEKKVTIDDLLQSFDQAWFKSWYEHHYEWALEKVKESFTMSLIWTAAPYIKDGVAIEKITLATHEIIFAVLNMGSIDAAYEIDGYDRFHLLQYFGEVGFIPHIFEFTYE